LLHPWTVLQIVPSMLDKIKELRNVNQWAFEHLFEN